MPRYDPVGAALKRRAAAPGTCLICGASLRSSPLLKGVRLIRGKIGECPNADDGRHGRPRQLSLKKLRKMQKSARKK